MTFDELALDPRVLEAVKATGYTSPTPIQEQAIPPALEGRDVLGIAQTGTGKTASFSLPMITRLAKGRARARMPRSLVLCPTRELAAQVAENFETYSANVKLKMALLIGGVSFGEQLKKLDAGVDVLIATPGRLLDHFGRGKLMLNGIDIMVVDEADRMLDMGFMPDIEKIFGLTPFTRQTLFFSATMPPEIQRITDTFLQNPVRIEVERASTAASTVTQNLVSVDSSRKDGLPKAKREMLRSIIESEGDAITNAIIFCNRKRDIGVLHKSLEKYGMDVASLHGDLDQRIRTQVLTAFRDGKIKLLIASDVAARGLDIPDVSHVFNFDVPTHAEDYVHRIGRTGRAGRSGKAYTLATKAEAKYVDGIEKMLGVPIPPVEGIVATPVVEETKAPAKPKASEEAAPDAPKARRVSRGGRGSKVKTNDDSNRSTQTEETPATQTQPEATQPEPAVEAKAPAEKPERRSNRGRRNESRAPRTEQTERPERAPRAERAERSPRPERNTERGGDRSRGRGNDRDGGRSPRGLGDHMPAFMLIPLPDLVRRKPDDDKGDGKGSVADAA